MPVVRIQPWPDEAWMTPEQIFEARARQEVNRAAVIKAAGGVCHIEQMTETEADAFYARYDRGMDGAVIAHRAPPALTPRRDNGHTNHRRGDRG